MPIGNKSEQWTLAVALAASTCIGGCHKPEDSTPAPLAPVAAEAGPPIDHLAPGELLEGTEKAFALILPRGLHIQSAFMKSVYAVGSPNMDDVANYIRARVRGGTVTRGATGTVFDDVTVPAEPKRILHILVSRLPAVDACRIEVRDITPAPPLPIPSTEAERFRAAGLTPSGKFIDPQHRQ